jgi:hypothetical protein
MINKFASQIFEKHKLQYFKEFTLKCHSKSLFLRIHFKNIIIVIFKTLYKENTNDYLPIKQKNSNKNKTELWASAVLKNYYVSFI